MEQKRLTHHRSDFLSVHHRVDACSDNGSQFNVLVSNSAGNVLSIPATLTLKPLTTPPGCLLSAGAWVSTPLTQVQTSSFRIQFDITPIAAIEDGVTGLSAAPAAGYTDLAAAVRFNLTGTIDARNGGSFVAATAIPYTVGTAYHFILDVNVGTHTYNAYVTLGSVQATIGTNLAFRTETSGRIFTLLLKWIDGYGKRHDLQRGHHNFDRGDTAA